MKKLFLLPILFFVLGCQYNKNDELDFDDLKYQNVHQVGLEKVAEDFTMGGALINDGIDTDAIAENLNDSLNDDIEAADADADPVADADPAADADVADVADAPDSFSEETIDDSFLKIHDNTAWKMIEETFTEYTLFYNSEKSFIKVHDFNGCNDSLQSNITTDSGKYIEVNLNTNKVTFEYFADEDYMERVEGIYRDTLSRVESTADALWSKLGCD